ncbi:type II toxin-antitoxin system VapC family toxin [Haliscomenobacter sp.]|uniref:type II toxin-antitoxin system VapC family toxin n=1 Tax=Haliscomenobacter sp. TaxID=2717303 RepID=UPI0035934B02
MGERYLLDTNILIYLQKGISDTQAITFLSQAIAANPKISVITEIEVLGFKFDSGTDLQKMEDLIADTVVLPLDKAVALKTISIRRMHKIKLPDAIIAATALVHELALITRNTSDFSSIDNLSVINPFAL